MFFGRNRKKKKNFVENIHLTKVKSDINNNEMPMAAVGGQESKSVETVPAILFPCASDRTEIYLVRWFFVVHGLKESRDITSSNQQVRRDDDNMLWETDTIKVGKGLELCRCCVGVVVSVLCQ